MMRLRAWSLPLCLAGLLLAWKAPLVRAEESRHPLQTSLAALREARREMEKSDFNFGGHKKEAIEATDRAIRHVDRLLGWVKENKKKDLDEERKEDLRREEKGERFPRIRTALYELRKAHRYVKESIWEFGDRKQKNEALGDIDRAINQLEKALEFAK